MACFLLCAFNTPANAIEEPNGQGVENTTIETNIENDSEKDSENNTEQKVPGIDIWEYRVEGNTLLDTKRIEKAVYHFLGKGKTIKDIELARKSLENEYRHLGYPTVLVDIPEQNVVNGIVKLRVTEGKIDRLRITGSRYYLLSKIREQLPSLQRGTVPHLPAVQMEMSQLNQEATGRNITPIMRPGRKQGTLEVELKVKDELPLHGSLEVNGRNSASTSRTRLIGSLRYDNLWQKYHSLSMQYQISPEETDEVEVLVGTYVFPVKDSKTRVALYAVRSDSKSSIASSGALSVIGQGRIYGARIVKPLPGADDYFHSLTFGADYKEFKEDVALVGADTLKTPITYMPLSVQYSHTSRDKKSITSYSVGPTFGIRGLVNDQIEFENKRIYSKENFFYVSGDIDYQRSIWSNYAVRGMLKGQIANSPLISNEQFGAGGAESVRGYYETQSLGDDGIIASLELHSPYLGSKDWKSVRELYALAFYDMARLWIQDPLPESPTGSRIASAGLGLRFKSNNVTANFDAGYPLKDSGTVKKGDTRLHFRMVYEF